AHDGAPVRSARIVVIADGATLAEVVTDESGEFEISLPGVDTRGALIRIESTWHSRLEKPLPPPGQLLISLLTRRRALLAALVDWAERRGRPFVGDREPTPREVREIATQSAEPAVATWARGVEDAAFGPNPVDADREAGVRAQEPKP
ncbi:MAG TPA: carboxypeptidase regulatory-like domain-containing protein, partial [Polyangiaceae bacterium]|nr:carboxypeptidase regulatory-like domain-containing protein [Polyangiaceae bacterium]